jgi:copper resistance protein C
MMKKMRAATFAIAISVSLNAIAHAFLDHALPAVGSQVHGSPSSVTVWFTQELEPAFSTVKVFDAKGNEVDQRDMKPDASDRTILRVSLPPLPPGTYRVVWRALSVDSHVTDGDFTFSVAP